MRYLPLFFVGLFIVLMLVGAFAYFQDGGDRNTFLILLACGVGMSIGQLWMYVENRPNREKNRNE